VVFYEMLTGRLPFDGPPLTVLARIRSEPPPPPSSHRDDLDPALEAIVLRALAQRPQDRYQSAEDLLGDLAGWETGGVTTAPAPAPAAKAPAKVRVELRDGTPVNVTGAVPAGASQLGVQVRERRGKKNRPRQIAVLVTITLSVLVVFSAPLWWATRPA